MHLQVRELPGGEFEEKVGREALAVAPHLPVQACGGDAVERGELGIERHPMTAQDEANTRRREGQATARGGSSLSCAGMAQARRLGVGS